MGTQACGFGSGGGRAIEHFRAAGWNRGLATALLILATLTAGAGRAMAQAGACCIGTSCTLRVQSLCDSAGGDWFGPGIGCSPNPCNVPGRCCSLGNCTVVAQTNCSGTWTQGGSCSPNPCPPPNGACCIAGNCSVVTQAACSAGGGTWTISGFCPPNPCPPAACSIGVPGRFGGYTTAVAKVGTTGLLIARGTNLEMFSLANPDAPAPFFPARRVQLSAPAVKISMSTGASRAFVLLENGDVTYVTVTTTPDVSSPVNIPFTDAIDIAADGDQVYMVTSDEPGGHPRTRVEIYERRADGTPNHLSSIDPFLNNFDFDHVVKVGLFIWIGMHERTSNVFGVEGWNVLDPGSPTHASSSLNFASLGTVTHVSAMTAIGPKLILSYRHLNPDDTQVDRMRVADVSAPTTPAWFPAVDLNGYAGCMSTTGNLVRVSISLVGVDTWDTTNPAALVRLGGLANALPEQMVAGAADDYWASGQDGLMTMNFSSPAAPSVRATQNVTPAFPSIVRQGAGNITAVCDSTTQQLKLYDYTLIETQQLRGSFSLAASGVLMEIARNGAQVLACVAVAGGGNIQVIDITTPTAPILRSTISGTCQLMAATNTRLYTFTYANELKVFDLSTPTSPLLMSTTPFGNGLYNCMTSWEAGATKAVALGTEDFGLWIINATTGGGPLVSAVYMPVVNYHVHGLSKGQNYLYVSSTSSPFVEDARLESLDVANLANPFSHYVTSGGIGAGSQGYFDDLSYVASPAGKFLVGKRPSLAGDSAYNDTVIFTLPTSLPDNEGVLYRIFTQDVPDARLGIAPTADGSRVLFAGGAAGLYQVAMPQTWAPGFSSPYPFQNQPVCYGGAATMSVSASANPNVITYQWLKGFNGAPLSNGTTAWGSVISGATTRSLTITNVRGPDADIYYCAATNSCGTRNSGAMFLDLCAADVNCSGTLTVQDIFDFLTAYFAGAPAGNFNGAGGISVQDIFDFLAAYFAGC